MTGAARGIGYSIAQRLGREGAAVIVSDVDDSAAAAAVDTLKQQGISAACVHCDVADSAQVRLYMMCIWHVSDHVPELLPC